MSSGSLRDVLKALENVLSSSPVPRALPQELLQMVQTYLDKHGTIGDQDSQRLQEELLTLYHKRVAGEPGRHAIFLASLKQLKPAIKGADRLLEWWDLLVRPTIDSLGQEKAVAADARALLLSVLVNEDDEDNDGEHARVSALFTKKLLGVYLEKTKVRYDEDSTLKLKDESYRFVSDHLESLLVAFGKRRPKDFLTAVDSLVTRKEHRSQALSLLCTFVRYQPPHLHQVLQTPLIEHLLKCLMIDISTTVLSLALTTLIMFLPHIPNSLVVYLPRLFIVYSRILCWDRRKLVQTDNENGVLNDEGEISGSLPSQAGAYADPSWEKLDNLSDAAEPDTPDLYHYFTFIYGLFPLNFMSYIRKPYKYLKNSNFPGADEIDIDQAAIRSRTESYRQTHLLHPNFFTMTVESELTDDRWLKSDPAGVTAECVGLCAAIPPSFDAPGPPPTSKLPEIPAAYTRTEDIPNQSLLFVDDDGSTLANESSPPNGSRVDNRWQIRQSSASASYSKYGSVEPLTLSNKTSFQSQSHLSSRSNGSPSRLASPPTGPRDNAVDSPTLPAQPNQGNCAAKLQDMLQTHESLRSSAYVSLPNDSVNSLHTRYTGGSPRLGAYINSLTQHRVAQSPSMGAVPVDVEVMLLRNDLNFERFLRQQHISHIGQLQRKHIKEATVESETQKLINANKTLKVRLEESKKSFAMLRKETATSKSQSKKWEGELSSKIRALREDQKQWRADEAGVRRELQNAQNECNHLRRLVVESEAKELLTQQQMESIELDLHELESLRCEVESLNARLRDYEAREDDFERGKENEAIARTQLETAQLRLRSRENEREKFKKAYDRKIQELESRVQSMQNPMPGQASSVVEPMLDSALALSHSRYNTLKKAHNHLVNRYTELEIRYMEVQAQLDPNDNRLYSLGTRNRDDYTEDFSSFGQEDAASLDFRRRQHALSDSSMRTGEYSGGHSGSSTMAGPISSSFPNPPTRIESLHNRQYPMSSDTSPIAERSTPFEASLSPLKSGQSAAASAFSSNNSVHSGESTGIQTGKEKPKIKAGSEVRVYGRGGVQNIGKKEKKDKEKKSLKAGASLMGIRGFGSG
ncbi:MAG: hypothetical protein M1827_002355 [Pycnora praestabilis]|nr:MAG: hypothetical protein M1827_002355 [Pycnora praestabilis]